MNNFQALTESFMFLHYQPLKARAHSQCTNTISVYDGVCFMLLFIIESYYITQGRMMSCHIHFLDGANKHTGVCSFSIIII